MAHVGFRVVFRAMEHRRLGDSDLTVSTVALGSWLTYSGGVGARADGGVHAGGDRRRRDVLRHRQRLRPRRGRARVGRDPRGLPARLVRAGHEGLLPDGRRATAGSRARRSSSRSTARWSGCRPTTSTSTSAIATTTTTPLEETMGALTEVVEAGKARHIGFSEWPAEQIEAALALPGVAKFVSSQPQYSALWRAARARGDPAVRAPRDHADRLVAARPGRADRQVPARASRSPRDSRAASTGHEPLHPAVAQRPHAARRPGAAAGRRARRALTLTQLALAWVLHQRNVDRRDRRRHPARAGARERRRGRRRAERRHAAAIDDALENSGGVVAAARSASRRPARPSRARARRTPPRAPGGRAPSDVAQPGAATRARPARPALRAGGQREVDLHEIADDGEARLARRPDVARPLGRVGFVLSTTNGIRVSQAHAQRTPPRAPASQQVHRDPRVRLQEAVAVEGRLARALEAAEDDRLHRPARLRSRA